MIIGGFCSVSTHPAAPIIYRAQCRHSHAFEETKFWQRTKDIWADLNIYMSYNYSNHDIAGMIIIDCISKIVNLSMRSMLSISHEIGLLNFYTGVLFVVRQNYSSAKCHWQITTVYWLLTHPLRMGHLRPYWASYAWVALACQFASVAYIFVKKPLHRLL